MWADIFIYMSPRCSCKDNNLINIGCHLICLEGVTKALVWSIGRSSFLNIVFFTSVFFHMIFEKSILMTGTSWQWSHGNWIYNYLCNQCLSPLMLWVRISITARCTTLCHKVCQWLAIGWWFSPGTQVSSTNKSDRHDITDILLKVALNTIKQTISKWPAVHFPSCIF